MALNSTFAVASTRGYTGGGIPIRAVPVSIIGNSGFPIGGFIPGDTVELRYSGSQETFALPAGTTATSMYVHVIGGGGGSQADCGGWCSDSGGAGGGGAKTFVTGIGGGNSWSFYVGRGGISPQSGEYCGSSGYSTGQLPAGERTWFNGSGLLYGDGGAGGWWCKDVGYYPTGGGAGVNWGTNQGTSQGGNGGGAHSGGGGAQPTAGSSSTWGGGGGGGSMDTGTGGNVLSNRLGGTGALGGYGGTGEYTGDQLRTTQAPTGCVPTPHRGGGAGGVASAAYSSSQVYGVEGAHGVILVTFA